jgi:hypothetical protein
LKYPSQALGRVARALRGTQFLNRWYIGQLVVGTKPDAGAGKDA